MPQDAPIYPLPERVRRLASRALEKYDAPEFQAFLRPVKTLLRDRDGVPLREWSRERVGAEIDFVVGAYISRRDLKARTPRETFTLVDARGETLRAETPYEADDLAVSTFDERAKTFGNLKHVKDRLTREDWIAEIAKAVLIASSESPHGYPANLSAVESRIIQDNWYGVRGAPGEDNAEVKKLRAKIKESQKVAAATDPHSHAHKDAIRAMGRAEETLDEVKKLASSLHYGAAPTEDLADRLPVDEPPREKFLRAENRRVERMVWRRHAYGEENEAGLSERERKVFRRALHLENREIAAEIGGAPKQIYTEKRRAVEKVRKAVGGL